MKKSILLTLFFVLAFGLSVQAQNEELMQTEDLTTRLKRYSSELVEKTYSEIKSESRNSRKEIEKAFLVQQFDSSVGLLQQMIWDERNVVELLDALNIVEDKLGDLPKSQTNESLLENARTTVKNIEQDLKKTQAEEKNKPVEKPDDVKIAENNNPILGRAFWRGMVDNKVHLLVKGSEIATRPMEGQAYPDGTFTFTAIFPRKEVMVGVNKREGRGNVSIFQQPTSENDYTAIIEIEDPGGGAKEYQVEIYWK